MPVLRFLRTSCALLVLCALCESAVAGDAAPEPPAQPAAALRTEVNPGAVVIEAEPLDLEPGIEELMRRFGDRLADHRPLDPVEAPLPSAIEVNTRYGRFCIAPLPTYLSSDLAGGLTLASRCAIF